MNAAEYLSRLPEEALDRLQRREEMREGLAVVGQLSELLTDPAALERVHRTMEPWEKQSLEIVLRRFGRRSFTEQEWDFCAPEERISGAELTAGLARLREKGIVFSMKKAWGERLFAVPFDVMAAWLPIAFPNPSDLDAAAVEAKPEFEAVRPLSRGLFDLIVAAARQPLALTKQGVLSKRIIQRLEASLAEFANGSIAAAMGLRYAHADLYSPVLALLLDHALRTGMLLRDGDRLIVDSDAVGSWLERPFAETDISLYRRLTDCLPSQDVSLLHAAFRMESQPVGAWISLDAMLDGMVAGRLMDEPTRTRLQERVEAAWLKPLALFGWIVLGRTENGGIAFQWVIPPNGYEEPEPSSNRAFFYVQPDFEIMAPPDTAPDDLWRLEELAERKKTDRVFVYKLTKERFACRLTAGNCWEEIVEWLHAGAKYGLPDNIRATLEEWGSQFGKVSLSTVTLLRCADERTAEEIASNPQCRPFWQEKIGSVHFLLLSEHVEQFILVLDRCGYSPRIDAAGTGAGQADSVFGRPSADAEDSIPGYSRRSAGCVEELALLYTDSPCRLYELDGTAARTEDIFPNLNRVPAMWLNDFRAYHPSTRKELIRQAIEWKAWLRVMTETGESRIVPKALEEGRSDWSLIAADGVHEMRLEPAQWEQMQIILPGVNDS